MKKGLRYLTIAAFGLLAATIIRAPEKKPVRITFPDDPQSRFEFELLKTMDPATRKVPNNIRQLELAFAGSKNSGSQISFAPGDIEAPGWDNRGPNNVGGRTRALGVDADDENIILAGGVSGGMWRSIDQGVNWTKTTASTELQSVTCIAQDLNSTNNDTWYYGTGEFSGNTAGGTGAFYLGDGIYKSTDNGQSWTLLSSTASSTPQITNDFDINHEIVVNPTNGDILVANIGGIYHSDDGGVTFDKELDNGARDWTDVVMTSTGVAFAVLETGGIFRSTDGENWTDISTGGPSLQSGDRKELAVMINGTSEEILYMLGENASGSPRDHMLWKYDDEVTNDWTDFSTNLPNLGQQTGDFNSQGGYDLLVQVDPDDENFVIIGGRNLWRFSDISVMSPTADWIGGYDPADPSNFGLYPNHHPDQHIFRFLSGTKAISGSDGGLHITNDITSNLLTNQPVSWVSMNNSYLTTQVYALSVGPDNEIFAGFQDNGTWLTTTTDGDTDWTETFSGDGGYSAWNEDGTRRYVSVQNGKIFRLNYTNGTDTDYDSETEITPNGYSTSLFIVPMYTAPYDDDLLFLGGDSDLYVNTQASSSASSVGWKSIDLGTTGEISEIGTTGVNVIYVGTSNGELYRIENPEDTNPTITDVTDSNFPSGYVSGVGINPFRPNEVLTCFSNYGIQSIFYSNDNGTTWTDVSGDLEENVNGSGNGPSVRTVRIHGDGDRFFAGTSTGLYSTTSLSGVTTTWTQEDANGIGNVVVEHLVTRNSDGLVVAGTHGNGVYSANFEVSPGLDDDLGINAITAPVTSLFSTAEPVTATVFNFGQNDQTAYDLTLFLDNVLVVTDNITTAIAANTSFSHTFSTTLDLSMVMSATIRVEVTLAGDENSFNDDLEKVVQNVFQVTSFPYFEGFETSEHNWENDAPWELGQPANTQLNAASEGTMAWVTDLDGNYGDNLNAQLRSPVMSFANLTEPQVSFDINFIFETDVDGTNYDGAVLAYRTDLSNAFTHVPLSWGEMNWYNSSDIEAFSNSPGWADNSGGYVRAQAQLNELAGEEVVQLAFIIASDESVGREGMAMDNFLVRDAVLANNAPSFTAGPNISIDRNSGPQSFPGWATAITDGDNASQKLTFTLTSDNNQLFTVQPAIALDGTLTFTTGENTFGIANVTATLTDDAWTVNDLTDDLSFSTTFVITELLTAVDDPIESQISVYPNPASDYVNVDLGSSGSHGTIELYSLTGLRLLGTVFKSHEIKIDLGSVPKGVYLMQVDIDGKRIVKRIMKD